MATQTWYTKAGLKLRHLQILVALDDTRNQRKAAAYLNVTQPALSKTMAELQSGLGQQLFERTGHGIKPTLYGACLIHHARRILHSLAETGEELHAMATETSRKARIGVLPALTFQLVPRALMLFKQTSPMTSISVQEATMDILLHELRLGNLDLVVGTLPTYQLGDDIEQKILFDDTTTIIVHPRHPLTKRKQSASWKQLAGYPWILPPNDSPLRQPLILTFASHGVAPPANVIETLSTNIIVNYLQTSMALATLPAVLARIHSAKGNVAILPTKVPSLARPVGLLWLRSQATTEAHQRFVDCLLRVVQEMP